MEWGLCLGIHDWSVVNIQYFHPFPSSFDAPQTQCCSRITAPTKKKRKIRGDSGIPELPEWNSGVSAAGILRFLLGRIWKIHVPGLKGLTPQLSPHWSPLWSCNEFHTNPGHVYRQKDTPATERIFWQLQHVTCRRGRPKITCMDQLRSNTGGRGGGGHYVWNGEQAALKNPLLLPWTPDDQMI